MSIVLGSLLTACVVCETEVACMCVVFFQLFTQSVKGALGVLVYFTVLAHLDSDI